MADNFKTISDLDISFKEFMPGQVIQSAQFNDDMRDIEEKVNEVIGQHNEVANTVVDHLNNKNNPHEVTAHQVGAYTVEEVDGLYNELREGNFNDGVITNRVLSDGCVNNRVIEDGTITASKVEDGFGHQIDISENIEITDRYTKSEVDELVRSKVGEGAYTKEEIDEKFQNFQAGQIIDKTISADKVTSDFGDKIDISNNTSIINRYTKGEVDILIAKNGLPRDWGGISDEPTDIENRTGSLPVAGYMVAGQFTSPATSVLDIDVKENVEARGEYSSVGERLDNVDSQIKDIANRIENVGQPTQEQINTAIDRAIEDGKITGGGINSTAKTLLISILQNAVYTTNQSANILALQTALSSESGGDTPSVTTYDITNNLTNCINNNVNTSVAENSSYVAIISANEGYTLDNVVITMGGTDITNSVYSNGTINIQNVTGNITITASATQTSTSTVITPVWNAGKFINGGVEGNYENYSLTDEIDVSAYNTLKFTTESTQWFNAPCVWYINTGETNYTLLDNNEGVAYMGGNYASELTYNITSIDKIKIGINRTDGYDVVKIEGVI